MELQPHCTTHTAYFLLQIDYYYSIIDFYHGDRQKPKKKKKIQLRTNRKSIMELKYVEPHYIQKGILIFLLKFNIFFQTCETIKTPRRTLWEPMMDQCNIFFFFVHNLTMHVYRYDLVIGLVLSRARTCDSHRIIYVYLLDAIMTETESGAHYSTILFIQSAKIHGFAIFTYFFFFKIKSHISIGIIRQEKSRNCNIMFTL